MSQAILQLLDDPDALLLLRTKLERDFMYFTRFFFSITQGQIFSVNHHHLEIADTLKKCTTAEILRLIVNMPPRYGKTELIVKMFMAWSIAKNPKAKFIHLSYSDELAFDNSSAVKEIILSDAFQRIWPEIQLKGDAKSKKKWYTVQGGGIYSTSSGGAITGFGAGSTAQDADYSGKDEAKQKARAELAEFYEELEWVDEQQIDQDLFYGAIIIDDPLKPKDAESNTVRGKINQRMINTIGSRVNSKKTPIIVVMQRLHQDDTSGFLLEGNTGEKWEQLSLQALYEENGELKALWPQKHSVEALINMRDNTPHMFAGHYQQTPTPAKGGLIDTSYFEDYRAEPVEFDQIIFSCDTAYKASQLNDPSVIMVFGKFRNRWYMINVMRERLTYPNLKRRLRAMYERYKPHAILIEDKASGQSLIQEGREDGMPVIAIQPEGDKVMRMRDQAVRIEAGVILIPEKSEWLAVFIDECVNFPKSKHDDQVDALSQFLKWERKGLDSGFVVTKEEMQEVAKQMRQEKEELEQELEDLYDEIYEDEY